MRLLSSPAAVWLRGTVRQLRCRFVWGVWVWVWVCACVRACVCVQGKAGEAETRNWNFVFDGVLDAGTSQAEVFDEVSNLVESVLEVCAPASFLARYSPVSTTIPVS